MMAFLLILVPSCEELHLEKANHALFRIINNTNESVEYSFFFRKAHSDEYEVSMIGSSTILPQDSIGGGFGLYNGSGNCWPSLFDYWQFDTLYLVISRSKLNYEMKSLPEGPDVYQITKYVKEDFENLDPKVDVAVFEYPQKGVQ